MLKRKKKDYKNRINSIAKASYNNEQKQIACQIIDQANEHNIDAIFQLITQRVKTGFVFDAAPEVNHDCVALIKENDSLFINPNQAKMIEHKLIIGENYDALKNLAVAYINPTSGEGLIDFIYIDPPYGTENAKEEGNDYKEETNSNKFIYRDKFTRDGWLNLMNERLKLSRKILTKDGVIFISIDDRNHSYLKVLCDEIFGEENLINDFVWVNNLKGRQISSGGAVKTYEHILAYAKNRQNVPDFVDNIDYLKSIQPSVYKMEKYKVYNDGISDYVIKNELYNSNSIFNEETRPNLVFNIHYNEETFDVKFSDVEDNITFENFVKIFPKENNNGTHKYHAWRWSKEKILSETQNLHFKKSGKEYKIYTKIRDYNQTNVKDLVMDIGNGVLELRSIFNGKVFDYPKSTKLIKFLIRQFPSNIKVLDFFAGSGTTAQAVMELNEEDGGNRQCILVTNNENNIARDVTWERLYRVINGKGSNNQKIRWTYSKEKKSLVNNCLRVFDIEYHELKLNDFAKAKKLIPIAEKQFSKLNHDYKTKNKFDIYNNLAALNPYLWEE